MPYYHCSPTAGLTVLNPSKPLYFNKPSRVCLTTSLPMALMYSIHNYEYSYGYTKDGHIFLDEFFPNALEILYRGKKASLYICDPEYTESTDIPNEAISKIPIRIISETVIPDACEALLEQEKLGNLKIFHFNELSDKKRSYILKAEADKILKLDLLNKSNAMADYYREHYPDSWAIAERKQRDLNR